MTTILNQGHGYTLSMAKAIILYKYGIACGMGTGMLG